MLTPEERALLTDLQDRIIKLISERDEARDRNDGDEEADAQAAIDRLVAECAELRRGG